MIPKRDLQQLRAEWTLDISVIEKDYVLGWLLAGIAHHPALAKRWIFKGGTCLRKCYYETFRFSEDLAEWLLEESGIELMLDDQSFQRRRNRRGRPTTQGRIVYQGPNPQPTSPKVKLDITTDEVLVERPELRPIGHPYSDAPLPVEAVMSYSLTELSGEKLRALAERCRPRDLYDVVHMHRHPDLIGRSQAVSAVLARKCSHAESSRTHCATPKTAT